MGKLYLDVSSCDSLDHFFSQFAYKPCSFPLDNNSPTTQSKTNNTYDTKINKNFFDKERVVREVKKERKLKEKVDEERVVHKVKKERKSKRKTKAVYLTAAERRSEPYRRVPKDHPWVPPISPFQLLQESYWNDHWKVLVICILCNRTRGAQAWKIMDEFFSICPSAEATLHVPVNIIEEKIRYLGLSKKRSLALKRFSQEYLGDWAYVTELYAVGKYAADAYAIFCSGHWRDVNPIDHKLVDYWKFLYEEYGESTVPVD